MRMALAGSVVGSDGERLRRAQEINVQHVLGGIDINEVDAGQIGLTSQQRQPILSPVVIVSPRCWELRRSSRAFETVTDRYFQGGFKEARTSTEPTSMTLPSQRVSA